MAFHHYYTTQMDPMSQSTLTNSQSGEPAVDVSLDPCDIRFETRAAARGYANENFGRLMNKTLRGGDPSMQGCNGFTLKCVGCQNFLVYCRKVDGAFSFNKSKCQLAHGSDDSECVGRYKANAFDLAASSIFGNISNSQSNCSHSSKGRMTIQATQLTCASAGLGEISRSIVGHARMLDKLSPLEHIEGMLISLP
jgi:hypothetical protein